MVKTALLVAILLFLGVLDWQLSRDESYVRSQSSRVRQLTQKSFREGSRVAALKLEDPARKEVFLYARAKDGWRCPTRFGTVADEAKIKSLLDKVFSAQGIVQPRRGAEAEVYGLGPGSLLRLSLLGPSRESLLVLDIGNPLLVGSGSYVRLLGSEEVVAVDANLREELAHPDGEGLAPLLDPHLVPGSWPKGGGVQRIQVEREDGVKFELVRREKRISPEEMKSGQLPWDWILKKDGREEICPPGPSNGYANFLHRAPYSGLVDPRTQPQLGLDRPAAKIILSPSEGEPLEVLLGKRGPDGSAPVLNGMTRNLFLVTGEVADLLAPSADRLTAAEPADDWNGFLRRQEPPPGTGLPFAPAMAPHP
jgi:hypothetical protein